MLGDDLPVVRTADPHELADLYGFPPPNIPELLYQEAKQPSPGRTTLLEEVCGEITAAEA